MESIEIPQNKATEFSFKFEQFAAIFFALLGKREEVTAINNYVKNADSNDECVNYLALNRYPMKTENRSILLERIFDLLIKTNAVHKFGTKARKELHDLFETYRNYRLSLNDE